LANTRCKGTTKSGRRCKSMQIGEDGYCRHHSPAREKEKHLAKAEEERKLTERKDLEAKAYDMMAQLLKRGDSLPPDLMPCGVGTSAIIRSIAEQASKDEQTHRLLLAEAEGYRRALMKEYGLTTALERMLADRIVLSYTRLLYMEAVSDVDHEGLIDTHEHLYAHRRAALRESTEFLRNVRALKELKTVPLRVMIKDAGQVNVGQQQVNVTDPQQVEKARQAGREALNAERSETQASNSTQAQEDVE